MDISFSFRSSGQARPSDPDDGPRLRVILAGGFASTAAVPLERVTIDNLEAVWKKLRPSLPAVGPVDLPLPLASAEDLHPDSFLMKIPTTARLLQILGGLRSAGDPLPFIREAEQLLQTPSASNAQVAPPPPSLEPGASPLDSLLGKPLSPAAAAGPSAVGSFIASVLRDHPSLIPDRPEAAAWAAAVEEALSLALAAILGDPAFRALENRWLGLEWLIRELDPEAPAEVFLWSTAEDEAAPPPNLAPPGDPVPGLVAHVEQPADPELYLKSLDTVARAAAGTGWPVLTAPPPSIFGQPDFAFLQDQPSGEIAGLVSSSEHARTLLNLGRRARVVPIVPRVLLRTPFRPDADPLESFTFTESTDTLPWGCGCFAAALCAARDYAGEPDAAGIGELPWFAAFKDRHGSVEAILGENAGGVLAGAGFLPLMAIRGRNALRIAAGPPR